MKALVAALASALVTAAVFVAPASGAADCAAPEPVFVYDTDEIAYTLTVDLSGCSWLKKKQSFDIRGVLERGGGINGQRQAGVASCARSGGTCRLILGMEHLPAEVAEYSGEISYIWRGKRRVFPLAKTCVSAVVETACIDG